LSFAAGTLKVRRESQGRRRVRIQLILTTFVVVANLIGIGVAILVVTITFPVPSIFDSKVWWITFIVTPAYIGSALVVGVNADRAIGLDEQQTTCRREVGGQASHVVDGALGDDETHPTNLKGTRRKLG